MKKIILLTSILAIAFLVSGCSEDANEPAEDGNESTQQGSQSSQGGQSSSQGGGSSNEREFTLTTQGEAWATKYPAGTNFSYKNKRELLEADFNTASGKTNFVDYFAANDVHSQMRDNIDDAVMCLNSNKNYCNWVFNFNYKIKSIELVAQVYYKVIDIDNINFDSEVTLSIGGEDFSLQDSETAPTPTMSCKHTFATPTKTFEINGALHNGGRAFVNSIKIVYLV